MIGTVQKYMNGIEESTFEEILKKDDLVLVDVFAEWCGPCKTMTPIFEELAGIYKQINFVTIDSDNCDWINKKYDIDSIPRFLFFKNGNLIYEQKGSSPKEAFEFQIKDKLLDMKVLNDFDDGITEEGLKKIIEEHPMAVIEFYKPNEKNFNQLNPFIAALSDEYKDVYIVQINADKSPDVKSAKEIKGVPLFQFYKNGDLKLSAPLQHPDFIRINIMEFLYEKSSMTSYSDVTEEKLNKVVSEHPLSIVFLYKKDGEASKLMKVTLYKVAELYTDIHFAVIDFDSSPEITKKYGIKDEEFQQFGEAGKKHPYFMFFKDGKLVFEAGPIMPDSFEMQIKGKLLELFHVDEFEQGIKQEEFEKIVKENKLVAVDIFTSWCQPCKQMKPIFADLSGQYKNVKFISLDLDYSPWMGATEYATDAIPTFLLIKEGKLVEKHIGGMSKDTFKGLIESKLMK